MERLLAFQIDDSDEIAALRGGDPVALGLTLAEAGCSVEAAPLIRRNRKIWAEDNRAEAGQRALETVAWWNKNWREFAQAMHGSRFSEAEELLGERYLVLWDQPSVLMHLSRLSRHQGNVTLVRHLLTRLIYLCDRGLPKMDMTVFRYAAQAQMIDVLCDEERYEDALADYGKLKPNSGNLMAHQIQGADLLALAGHHDAAMVAIAELLVTASARKTWGAEIRRDFVDRSDSLAPLRARADWAALLDDPRAYLKASKPARED